MEDKLKQDVEAIVKLIFSEKEEADVRKKTEEALHTSAATIDELTDTLEAKNSEVAELETKVADFESKTTAMESELEAARKEAEDFKSKLEEAETKIEEMLKDRATEVLATQIDADILMILTDVSHAFLNYGKANQKKIDEISIEKMKEYYDDGHFARGSMKPKVESAIRFIEHGGRLSIITSPKNDLAALKGKTGTRIVK